MAKTAFKSFDAKGPAFAGVASEGFDPRVLFPKRSTKLAKQVSLDWDKVLGNINKGSKQYAHQASRALEASRSYNPRVLTPTQRGQIAAGTSTSSAPLSAIQANNARAQASGKLAKNAKIGDIYGLMKGQDYKDLDAEGQQLYRQMKKAEAEIKMMGEKPNKDGPGLLDRVMDVLSRGNYMVANAVKTDIKNGGLIDNPFGDGRNAERLDVLKGAWKGVSGKEKTTFQEVIGDLGWEPTTGIGKVGKFTLGLGLDIALDPTTYLGIGAAKHVLEGGTAGVKAAKIGGVGKKITNGPKPAELQKLHNEINKILDLDFDSVGYKPLDEAGRKVDPNATGTGFVKDRELRREQFTQMFTGFRGVDGRPASRQKVAAQFRRVEHFLSYASKAASKESAAKTEAALKIVSSKEFMDKSAEAVYRSLEATAAADILLGMARQGKKFVDVPTPQVASWTLNKTKAKAFEKEMNKKIGIVRGKISKAKTAGKPPAEIKALKEQEGRLLVDRDEYKTNPGPRIGDNAPDERIYDVKMQDISAEVKAANLNNLKIRAELEAKLKDLRPVGIDETRRALNEIALRNVDPEVTRLIQVRFGGMFGGSGAVLATFKAPDVFKKALEKYARVGYDMNALNAYNKGVMAFSKTFRASGSLDQFIDAERLRTAGNANELISLHVKDLRKKFGKIKKADQIKLFESFMKGVPSEGLSDEFTPLMQEINREFDDMARLFDGSMYDKTGDLSWTDLNRWLPKKRVQLVKVDVDVPVGSREWWQQALKESNSKNMAEVLWQLRIAKEKMIARGMLTKSIEDTLGISKFSPAGESVFYQQLVNEHKYVSVKGFDESISFAPDIARDLTRLLELVDDQAKHADVIKGFDRVLNLWKSAVTVYNPAFHIRNGMGDMFVSFLNGMFVGKAGIPRAMKSHRAAIKTMRALKWNKMDPAARIRMMGENPAFSSEPLQGAGVGTVVLRVPKAFEDGVGDRITAEQLWGAYLKYGLKQAFTSTEFGKIVSSTRGARGAASAANEVVRGLSEGREDWFRLAHFADVLQRESLVERSFERAAAKAAEDVRKFHFDYSDFTPIERGVLVRAIPFYKWTRKSLPLMTEMLFAKPGAIAVYPKTQSNLSQMMGYPVGEDPLVPDSDEIIPTWVRSRGAVPLYTSKNGNTVFFDPSNPFNDTIRTWQGESPQQFFTGEAPLRALASMSNPLLRVPTELAFGRAAFGDRPIEGQRMEHLLGQSPQTSFIMKQINGQAYEGVEGADRLSNPETLNKILALGTIENTPQAQEGELRRINDILNKQRKEVRKKKGYPEPR